jgi:hypothetical protein
VLRAEIGECEQNRIARKHIYTLQYMPSRFVCKSFVELGNSENNYVVICVFSIKKKKKIFRPAGFIKLFRKQQF